MDEAQRHRRVSARASESPNRRQGPVATERTPAAALRSAQLPPPRISKDPQQGWVTADLLALQTLAGNGAVAGAVSRGRASGADSGHTPRPSTRPLVVLREPKKTAGERKAQQDLGREYEARVDRVLKTSSEQHNSVVKGIKTGVGHIDASVSSMNDVVAVYESAYTSVKSTIEDGKGEIAAMEAFAQAILGIAIGVGVGMALGAVTVFAKSASAGANLVGNLITEAGGETMELGVAQGLGALGPGGGGSGDALLERMNPLLRQLDIYTKASAMYRELALLSTNLGALGALAKPAATLKADSREVSIRGALSGNRSVDELKRHVEALERAGVAAAAVDTDVRQLVAKAAAAQTNAGRESAAQDAFRLERQLWLRWMGSLSGDKDLDVLRSGPVRGKLEALRLLGRSRYPESDIGWEAGAMYTESESESGIEVAKLANVALTLVGQEAPITEISDGYSGGPGWGKIEFKGMPWYKRSWTVMVDAQKDYLHDGDLARITHVWGRGEKMPWLYARLVSSAETDETWTKRAKYRRDLL